MSSSSLRVAWRRGNTCSCAVVGPWGGASAQEAPVDRTRCSGGLERLADVQWVVIHDVARPCVDRAMVYRGLEAAQATGAAVAAVPVTDTVKVVEGGVRVAETLDRSRLWAVQTPQVFRRDLLEAAFAQIPDDVTDEATMLERLGHEVHVFPGDYGNLKVTTPQDLALAEAILASRVIPEVLPSA